MMLSACSEDRPLIMPCPTDLVPATLLAPCPTPEFHVSVWGDYPEYVARLQLALDKCNTERATVAALLKPLARERAKVN